MKCCLERQLPDSPFSDNADSSPFVHIPALLLLAPSLSAENMDSFHAEVYFCRNCNNLVQHCAACPFDSRRERGYGSFAYILGVVKVLHNDGFDISIIVLHRLSYRNELAIRCRQTLSAVMTRVRSSTGLRPAKSTTCEMSSSVGSTEAILSDGHF